MSTPKNLQARIPESAITHTRDAARAPRTAGLSRFVAPKKRGVPQRSTVKRKACSGLRILCSHAVFGGICAHSQRARDTLGPVPELGAYVGSSTCEVHP